MPGGTSLEATLGLAVELAKELALKCEFHLHKEQVANLEAELARIKGNPLAQVQGLLGKADWAWDEDLNMHIPCCSRLIIGDPKRWKCGNGPLSDNQIESGDCGTHV